MHPEDIKATIRKRGITLTKLATDNGLGEAGCRVALLFGYPKAERVIVEFLDMDPRDLWPDRYRRPTRIRSEILDAYLSRHPAARHRQNERAA